MDNNKEIILVSKVGNRSIVPHSNVPGDPPVYYAQVWLNDTYGNVPGWVTLTEDGITGQNTMKGLVRALQSSIGTGVDGGFGAGTETAFESYYAATGGKMNVVSGATSNLYNIVMAGLWCKGYTGGYSYSYNGVADDQTISGLLALKQDAGISAILPGGQISAKLMKSLLSMDQFVLMASAGGKSEIRAIQQYLNANFGDYIGIIPCDGLYQRAMNEALIKRLQYIEGQRGTQVDGIFGNGTKNLLPILTDSNHPAEAVRLFNFCLTCNGYTTTGTAWNNTVKTNTRAFQSSHMLEETGNGDVNTWMALLLSKGNTDRPAQGCDCSTILDAAKANALFAAGYRYVGRYVSGTVGSGTAERSKALTKAEMTAIFNAGLRLFAIYQEGGVYLERYTKALGKEDAAKAIAAAKALDIPMREYIYFAVDYDVLDGNIEGYVKEYFDGIKEVMDDNGNIYNVGIYGSRNVCNRICSEFGLASSCFVGDMSTAYSGNMGFPLPDCWAFDQFHEYTFSPSASISFPLDKVAVSGRYTGFSSFGNVSNVSQLENDNVMREEAADIVYAFMSQIDENNDGYVSGINGNPIQIPVDASGISWESPPLEIAIAPGVTATLTYTHSALFALGGDKALYTTAKITNGLSPIFESSASYTSALFNDVADSIEAETSTTLDEQIMGFAASMAANVENGKISFGIRTEPNKLIAFVVVESYLGNVQNVINTVSVKLEVSIDIDSGSGAEEVISKYVKQENAVAAVAIITLACAIGMVMVSTAGGATAVTAAIAAFFNSVSTWASGLFAAA